MTKTEEYDFGHYVQLINWPEGTTDEQKEWMIASLREKAKEKSYIYVLYRPSCGCEYFESVLLDRFPMSPKIHSTCQECKKYSLHEIVDPIEFYLPLTETIYKLSDLKNMMITDGPQKIWLEAYQELAKMKKKKTSKKEKI